MIFFSCLVAALVGSAPPPVLVHATPWLVIAVFCVYNINMGPCLSRLEQTVLPGKRGYQSAPVGAGASAEHDLRGEAALCCGLHGEQLVVVLVI